MHQSIARFISLVLLQVLSCLVSCQHHTPLCSISIIKHIAYNCLSIFTSQLHCNHQFGSICAVSHKQHTTIIEKVDIHLPFHIEAHFPDAHIHRSNPIPVQLQSIQLTCSLEEWHWSLLQRWCSTWTRQIPLLIHREVSWLSSPCPIQIYICQRNVHLNLNMAEDVKMPDYASSVMKSLVPV